MNSLSLLDQYRVARQEQSVASILSHRRLAGKVIIVTGASSGIGEATARLLAAEGAHVILGARRMDRLATLAGEITVERGSARFHELDVTKPETMQAIVDYALDEFGRVDVIINNAGIMLPSPLTQARTADWDRMIDVNLRGVLHGIAAVLPVMQAQGFGQIVNLAALSEPQTTSAMTVYAATKAAVRTLSAGLRLEHDWLRVTLVSPGATASQLGDHIDDPVTRCEVRALRLVTISAVAVARAVLFAIDQPADVDVGDVTIRPTANPY